MRMRHMIGVMFAKLHASPVLLPIYNLLKITGIHRLGHIFFDFFERASPNEVMKKDREELRRHQKELQEAYRLLADERSRQVLKNAIRFRVTKNRKYLRGIIEGKQYFVKGIIKPGKEEVFVDCGAFDGDTLKNYLKFNRNYKKIVLFEPSKANVGRIKGYIARKGLGGIDCFQAGVGEKNCIANFTGSATADACISEKGSIQVQIVALDQVEECQGASFIKMDIEGSELEALKGAEKIIIRNKPTLAICIYHKAADYYQIPLYLHRLVPEYRLYVRHHFYGYSETVLYAVLGGEGKLGKQQLWKR